MLHEKYAPQTLEECWIHKKKKDEFKAFMEDKTMKIAIIWGPPGCGKNAMINAYAKENNIQVDRYNEWK